VLTITVPGKEYFDESKGEAGEFVTVGDSILELEHSLVSLSKWESIFEKPFLGSSEKSNDEILAYIYAMIITPGVSPDMVDRLTADNFKDINRYLDAKMTATWFSDTPNSPKSSEVITSELIYYWMTIFNIPMACENWHLNRLFTLIKVCNAKNSKPKKMGRAEAAARRRELNAQRRAQLGSSG